MAPLDNPETSRMVEVPVVITVTYDRESRLGNLREQHDEETMQALIKESVRVKMQAFVERQNDWFEDEVLGFRIGG